MERKTVPYKRQTELPVDALKKMARVSKLAEGMQTGRLTTNIPALTAANELGVIFLEDPTAREDVEIFLAQLIHDSAAQYKVRCTALFYLTQGEEILSENTRQIVSEFMSNYRYKDITATVM